MKIKEIKETRVLVINYHYESDIDMLPWLNKIFQFLILKSSIE